MSDYLDGKVAIVTGGSSGMGRRAAIRLAEEGASVVVAARREREGQSTVDEITKAGGAALFVRTDVSVEADVERMVNSAIAEFGSLDCAFNNAGRMGGRPEPWTHVDADMFDEYVDPNLRGVWLCMKHEMRAMSDLHGGSIVNNSSMGGVRGGPEGSHIYAATKHGVIGLTRNAATNYGQLGIRVNAVCPGFIGNEVWTNRFEKNPGLKERIEERVPLRRLGTEDDVASAVLWLLSDASAYVTGTTLLVDGGFVENAVP